jgi:hypothetical protein
MTPTTVKHRYRPTESKYKGGAKEMYVTYDLKQTTRGGGSALYPKVKRLYIAGEVAGWKLGQITKKSGREVNGLRVEYEQSRAGYRRRGFAARRGKTAYNVAPASVSSTSQRFVQVVDLPKGASNVQFHSRRESLPERYRHALQHVR